jgi:hypothetical protein
MDRYLDLFRSLLGLDGDDVSRGVALVLALMGTLAVLSFVLAGVVGA